MKSIYVGKQWASINILYGHILYQYPIIDHILYQYPITGHRFPYKSNGHEIIDQPNKKIKQPACSKTDGITYNQKKRTAVHWDSRKMITLPAEGLQVLNCSKPM